MTLKIASVMLLAGASLALADPVAPIAGDYLEARSNHVYTCGCLYSGEMVTDGREAILVWSFHGGRYLGASLQGIKAAAVLVAEGNLSLPGSARRAVLYLDGANSDVEKAAVASLLSEQYGAVIGEIVAVRTAPIVFQKGADWASARIPGIAEVEVRTARLPEDAHPGSAAWYEPFVALVEPSMAMTLLYEYRGNDFARQWRRPELGITSYFGKFALRP